MLWVYCYGFLRSDFEKVGVECVDIGNEIILFCCYLI